MGTYRAREINAGAHFLRIPNIAFSPTGGGSVWSGPSEATVRAGDAERHQRRHRCSHPLYRRPAQRRGKCFIAA